MIYSVAAAIDNVYTYIYIYVHIYIIFVKRFRVLSYWNTAVSKKIPIQVGFITVVSSSL